MLTTSGTVIGSPGVPLMMRDEKEHRRQIAQAVNRMNRGLINCSIDVTLAANTTNTLITSATIGFATAIIAAMPMTSDAASDIGTIWVDTIIAGSGSAQPSAKVHHRNNAGTDRTIRFVLLG